MNIDPHNHEQAYKNWKAGGAKLDGIQTENAVLLRQYLNDMEIGANVSPVTKKGSRSYGRLRNLKSKLLSLTLVFEKELHILSLQELDNKELEILGLFKRMRDGEILSRKNKGKPLKAVGTYVKTFKAFWHWYQRYQRKNGVDLKDITTDLDGRDAKPSFNYFTIEDVKKLCNEAKYEYKVLMMFLFDTGIRAPTELMNVKLSDLEWNLKTEHYTLNIREETSKTFGRKIKLLLCSDILKEYIQKNKLKNQDYLFTKKHHIVNQYLKNLGYRVLNVGKIAEKQRGNRTEVLVSEGITMYDFRHGSACYWLPRYKSESALKYRFGWKKSDMIHYYTELLGMKDTIEEDDLYVDISKTELEKQIMEKGKQMEIMQEQLQEQDKQLKDQDTKMQEILNVVKALHLERQVEQQVVIQTPT
ncbi:MAG: site-specific integrase [Nanoarchaeota archaeon]|nr:site-specific integrase [Nanoarchaeota archaeon]